MSGGAQTIALAPLSDAETSSLVGELLGSRSIGGAISGAVIAGRAAGNPFFVQEIARDLAERGVLVGELGEYACRTDVAEVTVPATCRRPSPPALTDSARRLNTTLAAAAVIGSRFDRDLLASLEVDPVVDELMSRGAHRPSAVHPGRGVRVSASADPHGRLRNATEVRSRAAASAAGRHNRSPRGGIGGAERRIDRRTFRGSC